MSRHPVNDTFKGQQKKLVRATFKQGVVVNVNISAFTMDVSFVENPQNVIRSIPVAKSVAIGSVVTGQKCRIDLFDETNPNSMVVAYVF